VVVFSPLRLAGRPQVGLVAALVAVAPVAAVAAVAVSAVVPATSRAASHLDRDLDTILI
jgi:hypothetical protein